MSNYSSIGSYTSSITKNGVRQLGKPWDFSRIAVRLAEWKQVGKIVIWILPVLLVLNVMCSSAISSMNHSIGKVTEATVVLETKNLGLLAERAIAGSELNVKKRAEDTLGLVAAVKGQVGLFNRQYGSFQYKQPLL